MYSLRPSAVLGVDDPWAAYQFDMAVGQFGAWVEGKLSERDKAGKPKHTLAGLLAEKATGGERQYASVAGLATRTVRVKEDGTWDD